MSTLAIGTCGDSIMIANPGPSAHPAWSGSTGYTAVVPGAASAAAALTSFATNGGNAYACIQSGTSASSGGPTTTSLSIADGTAKWAYLGPVTAAGFTVPGWVTWLVAMALAAAHAVTGVNDGLSGSTSIAWVGTTTTTGRWWLVSQPNIDWRFAKVLAFLSIGTNDFAAISGATESLTGQQVADNAIEIALQILQAAQANGGNADVVLTSCMQTANFTGAGLTAFTAFNAAIAAFCTARGLTLLDHANVAGVTKLDGTHPDAAGHAALANADWPLVSGKFK